MTNATIQERLQSKRIELLRQQVSILGQRAQNAIDFGLTSYDILDGIKISHQDTVLLSATLNAQADRIDALEKALREAGDVIESYYKSTGIDLGDASRMPFYADTIAKIDAALGEGE